MIPVDQTTFGHPGGNCFSACVASLLEIQIGEVPYLMEDRDWFQGFIEWLRPRGLWAVTFSVANGWRPDGYVILGGQSPRGSHAVVGLGLEVVHDPHPSRAGLTVIEDATIIIPIDPAAAEKRRSR